MKKAKGGYIVECDKMMKSKDAYDGMRYIGRKEEVFEDGDAALARMNELYVKEMAMEAKMMEHMKSHPEKKNSSESY